jgi:exonuclease III
MTLSSVSLELEFLFQSLFFILLLSGDIELNPGPMYDRVIDIFHLNVRSIRNKIDDLYAIVHEFDIVCFTETHLDKNVTDDQIKIDGFNCIFRKDRNCYGGGVLIYLSNPIQAIRRSDLEPANVECIWIEIENSTSNFLVYCVYRPPHADTTFWTNFSWSVEKAGECSDKIIILGDLNVDFLNIPLSFIT